MSSTHLGALCCLSARGCILQVLPDLVPSHPARSSAQYWQLRSAWPCQQAAAAFLQSPTLLDLLANVLGCSRNQLLLYNGADRHFLWIQCTKWFPSSLLPPQEACTRLLPDFLTTGNCRHHSCVPHRPFPPSQSSTLSNPPTSTWPRPHLGGTTTPKPAGRPAGASSTLPTCPCGSRWTTCRQTTAAWC